MNHFFIYKIFNPILLYVKFLTFMHQLNTCLRKLEYNKESLHRRKSFLYSYFVITSNKKTLKLVPQKCKDWGKILNVDNVANWHKTPTSVFWVGLSKLHIHGKDCWLDACPEGSHQRPSQWRATKDRWSTSWLLTEGLYSKGTVRLNLHWFEVQCEVCTIFLSPHSLSWWAIDATLGYCVVWGDDFIFQQDLGHAHTTNGVYCSFNSHGVTVLDWPANSPDLNLIETLCSVVKRKMSYHYTYEVPQGDCLHSTVYWYSNSLKTKPNKV